MRHRVVEQNNGGDQIPFSDSEWGCGSSSGNTPSSAFELIAGSGSGWTAAGGTVVGTSGIPVPMCA